MCPHTEGTEWHWGLCRLSETLFILHVTVCEHVRACTRQPEDNLGCHPSDAIHISSGRQDPSSTWGSQVKLDWLASEPSRLPPERELQACTTSPALFVAWVLGTPFGPLCLTN